MDKLRTLTAVTLSEVALIHSEVSWVRAPVPNNIIIPQLWDVTRSHCDSTGLSSVLSALTDSGEKPVVALYYSSICTDACNERKLGQTLVLGVVDE